jgi:Tol biopolymer transport system component
MERVLAEWLHEGPESGTSEGLERSLAATRRVGQRPGWTLPERWIPMELTIARARMQPAILAIALLALLTVALVAAALFVAAQRRQPPLPFRNGVIALANGGDIFVADRPGGDLRQLVAGPGDDRDPMFSPDGTRLAFERRMASGVALMIAAADGTHIVQLTPPGEGHVWSFAPDGRSLMTLAVIDGVRRFDPADQGKRVVIRSVDPAAPLSVLDIRLPGPWMDNVQPHFRPTNPREILVFAHPDPDGPRGLYVYDLLTGGMRTVVEAPGMYVDNVAWLPDGRHITYNGRIVAADGSGDRAIDSLRADDIGPFSNDGTRIVAWDRGGGASVVPIDGQRTPVALACGPGTTIDCPEAWTWSPDDSMLLGAHPSHDTSSLVLQADPDSGQVIELDWVAVGEQFWGMPTWQRVAP